MATDIAAITLDFFETLAHHRGDGGRGRAIMRYLAEQGIESAAWQHQILYDVLEPHAREYAPTLSAHVKREYLVRLTGRLFERMGVSRAHDPAAHAQRVWQLIGPSSLALYEDVHGALRGLRAAGYRLAVVSNWQCGLGHFCEDLGIRSYFDHVIASAEVGSAKPDRTIFDTAVRRLGVPSSKVLHIGDSIVEDLQGARAAGLHALLLDRNGDEQGSPTNALRGLEEVVTTLERWPSDAQGGAT
jgi:HAD superfamily hydrolase (TIGR01549 family)